MKRKTDMYNDHKGFTLIEVLLALVIIAISLTALLRATGQDVRYMHRLRHKTSEHWVARQAVTQIQSNLITVKGQTQTLKTTMLGEDWYWRPQLKKTPIPNIHQIIISVSSNQSGPFQQTMVAYKLDI